MKNQQDLTPKIVNHENKETAKPKFDVFSLTDIYSRSNPAEVIIKKMAKLLELTEEDFREKILTEDIQEKVDEINDYQQVFSSQIKTLLGIGFNQAFQVNNNNSLEPKQLWFNVATKISGQIQDKEVLKSFKLPNSDEFCDLDDLIKFIIKNGKTVIKNQERLPFPTIGTIIKYFIYGNQEILKMFKNKFRYLDDAEQNLAEIKAYFEPYIKQVELAQNKNEHLEPKLDEPEIIIEEVLKNITVAIEGGDLTKLSSVDALIGQAKYKDRPLRFAFASRLIYDGFVPLLVPKIVELLESKSFVEKDGSWKLKTKRNSTSTQAKSKQDIKTDSDDQNQNKEIFSTLTRENTDSVGTQDSITLDIDESLQPELIPFAQIGSTKEKPKKRDLEEYDEINKDLVAELQKLKNIFYNILSKFISKYPETSDLLSLSALIDTKNKTIFDASEPTNRKYISELLETSAVTARKNDYSGDTEGQTIFESNFNLYISVIKKVLRDIDKLGMELIEKNIRLIHWSLQKALNTDLSQGPNNPNMIIFDTTVTYGDLMSNACTAVYDQFLQYDPDCGYKMSTSIIKNVKWKTFGYLAKNAYTIRMPNYIYNLYLKINKTKTNIQNQNVGIGNKELIDEVVKSLDISLANYNLVIDICKNIAQKVSLESYFTDIDEYADDDVVPSSRRFKEPMSSEDPYDIVTDRLLAEDLESVLGTLSPRERDVLRLRYGFDNGRMKTLEEIGEIFNVTRERIRQVEAKALRKLRHPNRNGVLKEYIR